MESDGQRLYSVLTKTELREKMMKEIVQISDVFSLSQSDATVALIRLGWNSFRASDLLGDDKEKFMSELGLVRDPNESSSDGEGRDTLVSTPFCSHKFCSDCWRDHLSESLEKDKTLISCLNQDCVASVGPDTVEKLAKPVKEMYDRYVLGSFMESKSIKWCPAPKCDYAIERHEDDDDDDDDRESSDFGVVCLCGHTFCWSCKLESHRPVTCNNASLWLKEHLDEARVVRNIKTCPRCNRNVQKPYDSRRFITCDCRHAFCWRCLKPEGDHTYLYKCIEEVCVPRLSNHRALLCHMKLWEVSHESMEKSKRDLEDVERNVIPVLTEKCGLGEADIRALREACVLIVQCRLVLKWSSVFGYFITDYHNAKKLYLDHIVDEATANLVKHKETVDELTRRAVLKGVVIGFRHKLETSTTMTGNYFHYFVKTLEDGLPDVKAGVYENVATDYWFCDRCTFQNDSSEEMCRMCVAPFESPPPSPLGNKNDDSASDDKQEVAGQGGTDLFEAFGNNNNKNNNTASAHQQGVPNMPSGNPFAREGGTNLFETPPLMAFGNNSSVHQQQVPNNPFARQGGTNLLDSFGNSSIGASVHQQQVPNMGHNPFDYPGGKFYCPTGPPRVEFSKVVIGASGQNPNMASNPFAREGGTYYMHSPPPPPLFVAYGNNSIDASAYQQEAPNMANNPFARRGGTYYMQSPPPFVGFGNNNTIASGHLQQVPNIPLARQGGTNPLQSRPVAFGNNNSSASGHQQQAQNMMGNNPFALQGAGGTSPLESRPVAFGNNNSTASVHQQQVPDMPKSPLGRQGETKP